MKGRKHVSSSRRVVTDEQIELMNELRWGEQKMLKEIADQTGMSAPTVCRYTAAGANWRVSNLKSKTHGKRGKQ